MEATDIWGEIERSESYLVCSMYEEAESLSSSILKRIFGNIDVLSDEASQGDHQFHDMLESAGMVLVQSLHGIGRYISFTVFRCYNMSSSFASYFCLELDALKKL
jgi:hypothetical protein